MYPWAKETKNKHMGLHKTKEFLHSEGNHEQNENTAYWMGNDIHQWYIWKEVNVQYKELMQLNTKKQSD